MNEAVQMVAAILTDHLRSDRYLRWSEGGGCYYSTPDKTYLSDDGPYTPPYVSIPYAGSLTEEEAEDAARELIEELDRERIA